MDYISMRYVNFKVILLVMLIFNISFAYGQTSSIEEVKKLINNGKFYEAETLLIKSVKVGDIKAIRFYSICLIKGKFFNKNLPKGLSVLKEGAKFNDAISAFTLGNFFSNGVYLKPNYERANFFYNIAFNNGMKKAKINIDRIATKLIEKEKYEEKNQIVKAPKKIKPKYYPPKQKYILGVTSKVPSWKEDYLDWDKVTGFGSAFAISNNGKFVTNEHVVNKCKKIFIKYKEKYKIANLIFKVKKEDIAVIDIKASTPSFFGFRKENIKLGQELISGGYPLPTQLDYDIKITTGIVSSSGKNRISKKHGGEFQHTTPTQPGNSGGPLISRSGQVIGMTKSILRKTKEHVPQNVNFAVAGTSIKNYLKKYNISYYLNEDTNKYDFENLAARLEQTAAQVICY